MSYDRRISIKRLLFYCSAAATSAYSCLAFSTFLPQVVGVFRFTEPVGLFGWFFHIFFYIPAVASNIAAIFLLLAFVWGDRANRPFAKRYALISSIISLKLLEAAALLPCVIGPPDALCGVGSVVVSQLTAPLIIIFSIVLVISSGDPILRYSAAALSAVLFLGTSIAYYLLAPTNPGDCLAYSGITQRAVCLHKFAQTYADPKLCHTIEFRSFRFACFRDLAEATRDATVCEQIKDPLEFVPQPYESPSTNDRDICYWLMSFKLQKKSLCMSIANTEDKLGLVNRGTCLSKAGVNGWTD